MADDSPSRSPMERHIQSGVLAVAIALLLWVGNSVTDVGKSIVVLQTQFGSMSQQIGGTYRTSDAQRDRADSDRAFIEIRARVSALEDLHRSERRRP